MWDTQSEAVASGFRYQILSGDNPLSFRDVFGHLLDDAAFRDWYTDMLAAEAGQACFWEHPPLTEHSFDNAAEFVLINAPMLARMRPEPEAFADQFARHVDDEVITFANLGGDALLVAPTPVADRRCYPHLAPFVRTAPKAQVHALWAATAQAVHNTLGTEPRWLSTSGLGVAWLHIRVDTRPKYYQHQPYKNLQQRD